MPAAPNPSGPPTALPREQVRREVEQAAASRAVEAGYPADRVAAIRRAAARLGATGGPGADLRHAALLLERQAVVDIEVPTAGRWPGLGLVKSGLKKLMMFYVRYLGHQITAFGQATARFGLAVASRVEGVEVGLSELEERVGRLERGAAPPADRE